MINTPPIHGSTLPPPESEDAAAATPDSDDDGDGVGDVERVTVLDRLGEGVTEGVGVGDGGPTVGDGVDFTSLSLIVTRTSGPTS
jgi:hypothetical protein